MWPSISKLKAAGIDMTQEKPLLLTISVTEDEIRGIGGENIVRRLCLDEVFPEYG